MLLDYINDREDLCEEQRDAVRVAIGGANLFLTGAPGTGKSHTLRVIIEALSKKFGANAVLKTAPTGAAAILIHGQTLHTSPGPGVPNGTVQCFGKMTSRGWGGIRVLIIDEISMVDAEYFDWYFASIPNPKPQVILCGDFHQLPPVANARDSITSAKDLSRYLLMSRRGGIYGRGEGLTPDESGRSNGKRACEDSAFTRGDDNIIDLASSLDPQFDDGNWRHHDDVTPIGLRECTGKYAFQSMAWRELNLRIIVLDEVHRTSDQLLIDAQRAIREGRADDPVIGELVRATSRPIVEDGGIRATVIMPRRDAVFHTNQKELNRLLEVRNTRRTYDARDGVEALPRAPSWVCDSLKQDSFFKKDCPAEEHLQLGIGAQVMLLYNEPSLELVNGSRGVVVGFLPVPVDHVAGKHFDLRRCEERADGTVVTHHIRLEDLADVPASHGDMPVVRFSGDRLRLVVPHAFEKDVYGKGKCVRNQIPLALAWALTVHKAQGASLDAVTVDLDGTFGDGQTYVAISRAKSLRGLEVRNFRASAIHANSLVSRFYEALASGTHDTFVRGKGMWWGEAIFEAPDVRWKHLFERHPRFLQWSSRL